MRKNNKKQARPSAAKGEAFDSAVRDQMVQLQDSIKLSAMDLVSDAVLTATSGAAREAVMITVLSLREGFEALSQRGMSAFFNAAVFYIATSKSITARKV